MVSIIGMISVTGKSSAKLSNSRACCGCSEPRFLQRHAAAAAQADQHDTHITHFLEPCRLETCTMAGSSTSDATLSSSRACGGPSEPTMTNSSKAP